MSNYENIRPYSEFAHEAAQYGGVEKYLDIIADTNRKLGIAQGRKIEIWKGILLVGGGIASWEGGKRIYRSIKDAYHRRKQDRLVALQQQSDDAKAAIRNTMNRLNSAAEKE